MTPIYLGIDAGSTTVKVVITDGAGRLLDHDYRYGRGQPARALLAALRDLGQRWDLAQVAGAGLTGSGSELLAPLLGARRVNELVAQTHALEAVLPQARTVVEVGGQDSKLLRLEPENGRLRLADFAMNTLCAAGTGSFLDQQAERLGLSLAEFSALALQARQPARVAGRCAVFAKSDLVHLQQQGASLPDLVAGLCLAVARNLRATLGSGQPFQPPIVFQGGVARNAGMVWALEQVLGLEPGALLVPPHCTLMAALGAAHLARVEPAPAFRGLAPLAGFVDTRRARPSSLPRLFSPSPQPGQGPNDVSPPWREGDGPPPLGEATAGRGEGEIVALSAICPSPQPGQGPNDVSPQGGEGVWLGIDVGSISTKAAAVDGQGRLLAGCYLPTAGQPLDVARRALAHVLAEVGETAQVLGTGVTGSCRRLVAERLGADLMCNEIRAQARAARTCDPEVDTVFEIGGQDSKYIILRDGTIADQALNKACAAGTGAFLEEQAQRLGLPVAELGRLALTAAAPADLGERCTVFVESDLVHHQQQGANQADLAAGLAYAVARNYLARVVDGRAVGRRVLFQGGVALNPAVVAAFEALLARPVVVPPRPELSGAVGAALLAGEESGNQGIRESGGQRSRGAALPDLFAEREGLLLRCLDDQPTGQGRPRVGFPRVLAFYDLLPYWGCFFRELGWEVVLSPPTTPELAARAAAEAGAETCFPVKLAYGHVLWLLEQGVERIFLPSVVNRADPLPGHSQSYHCPFIQAVPHLVEAALHQAGRPVSLLRPPVHFLWSGVAARELRAFARELGLPARQITAARRAAEAEQRRFEADLRRRGAEVLAGLAPGQVAAVLVGRAYSTADPGLNADLPAKLRRLGVLALPLDCLPLDGIDVTDSVHNMFWHTGQRFLAAAQIIRDDPRLQAVYLTHFACGPDSFLLSFFREALGGKSFDAAQDKPFDAAQDKSFDAAQDKSFLELELDDHSGDAGLLTRLEAFFESGPWAVDSGQKTAANSDDHCSLITAHYPLSHVYIPDVCDPTHVLAAAMRAHGLRAEVLPPSTAGTLALGRDLCLGRECLPCHTLVGDIVQRAHQPGFEPDRAAYLIPTSAGPCRLGQFHDLLRQVLRRQGLGELRVVAPSAENGYQYEGLGVPPLRVGRLAWQGLVALDFLEKQRLHHRPYERAPGSADRLYDELLARLVAAVEAGGGRRIPAVLDEAARRFAALAVDRSRARPIIGLVGEIYLRLNPFTNQQIVRRVEALGGEVWLAPMSEWLYYANHFSRFSAAAEHRYGNLLRLHLIRRVLDYDEGRLLDPVAACLPNAHEPPTAELLAAAAPYFHPVLRTEAPLTIGKAIDFARQGLDGILNVMPFTCMPGTVVAGLAGRIRADWGGIPWLDVSFDGLGETNQQTRLEAFMHQAEQFRCRKGIWP